MGRDGQGRNSSLYTSGSGRQVTSRAKVTPASGAEVHAPTTERFQSLQEDMMLSIRRSVVSAVAVGMVATAFACRDVPSSPVANDQGTQGTATTGGNTRSDAPATGLAVTPGALFLRVGTSGSLVASLVDASGAVVSVPSGPLPWTSSNAAVATVNESGVVTGVAAGSVTVSVSSGGLSGSAQVTVN
jgi:uncharacterized protein YjdB